MRGFIRIATLIGGWVFLLVLSVSAGLAIAQGTKITPGRSAGGLLLQSSMPGTAQTGNFNMTGTALVGALGFSATGSNIDKISFDTTNQTMFFANLSNTSTHPAFSFRPAVNPNTTTPAYEWLNAQQATVAGIYVGLGFGNIKLSGCAAGTPCLTTTDSSPVVLGGGTVATSVSAVNGLITTPAFSLAVTGVSVSGSSCITNAVTVSGSYPLTIGQACIAAGPIFANTALTLTCEVTSATNINLRTCNTGTNAVTQPTGTYYARILQ